MIRVAVVPFIFAAMPVLADHPIVAFGTESSGSIITISAPTMLSGTLGVGIRTELIENDAFSDQQLVDYANQGIEGAHSVDKIMNTALSLAYGLTDDLTLSARLPYVERKNIRAGHIEAGDAEVHNHGDSSGLGDLVLFGQYRIAKTEATDLALLLGIKAPTGKTDVKDISGERFETEFQPGTGSWDLLIGSSVSHVNDKFGYHANVLFNKTSEGSQATEIGDVISYNLAMSYQLNGDNEDHSHHHHSHHHDSDAMKIKWDAIIELNGETRRKNKIAGDTDQNSGGTILFVSPGIRLTAGKIGGFVSVGLPIVENMNGKQTDVSTRIVAGLSVPL